MDIKLIKMIEGEEHKGRAKWGHVDTDPTILLNAATEELGEIIEKLERR